jgi:hypothetical protein
MSNIPIRPSLITGANAKIKFGRKVVAYATSVEYNITTDTIPVEVMGRYEVVNYEPVGIYVGGSLSVVRYSKGASSSNLHKEALPNSNSEGNSSENIAPGHFNPATIINSNAVELEIFQKLGKGAVGTSSNIEDIEVIKVKNCRLTSKGGGISKRGHIVEVYSWVGVLAQDDGDTNIQRTKSTGEDLQ